MGCTDAPGDCGGREAGQQGSDTCNDPQRTETGDVGRDNPATRVGCRSLSSLAPEGEHQSSANTRHLVPQIRRTLQSTVATAGGPDAAFAFPHPSFAGTDACTPPRTKDKMHMHSTIANAETPALPHSCLQSSLIQGFRPARRERSARCVGNGAKMGRWQLSRVK